MLKTSFGIKEVNSQFPKLRKNAEPATITAWDTSKEIALVNYRAQQNQIMQTLEQDAAVIDNTEAIKLGFPESSFALCPPQYKLNHVNLQRIKQDMKRQTFLLTVNAAKKLCLEDEKERIKAVKFQEMLDKRAEDRSPEKIVVNLQTQVKKLSAQVAAQTKALTAQTKAQAAQAMKVKPIPTPGKKKNQPGRQQKANIVPKQAGKSSGHPKKKGKPKSTKTTRN
jgi:hypothetical protein